MADLRGVRGAAGLGGPLGALDGQPHPGQVFQHGRGAGERPGRRGLVVHRGQARGQGRARHAELGVTRREPVLAGRAVVPGAVQRDRAQDSIDDLVAVGDEQRLMAVPARHRGAAVPPVGRQQLPEHAAAELEHPGPDHRLRGLQAGVPAAQRPGGCRGQPRDLGGPLVRERPQEPFFSPPVPEGSSSPALPGVTGRASQIASFTSVTCPARSRNRWYSATSRLALSSSGPGLR